MLNFGSVRTIKGSSIKHGGHFPGSRSPGLVLGWACTSHLRVLGSAGSIPKREELGKTGRHPVLKNRVPHGPSPSEQLCNRYCSNKHTLRGGGVTVSGYSLYLIPPSLLGPPATRLASLSSCLLLPALPLFPSRSFPVVTSCSQVVHFPSSPWIVYVVMRNSKISR
jgi:hypothetical protein